MSSLKDLRMAFVYLVLPHLVTLRSSFELSLSFVRNACFYVLVLKADLKEMK